MKRLIILISAIFFIAATPLYINAHDTKSDKNFNQYERVQPENNWKNEYWPQHQMYRHSNNMHNQYNQRHQMRRTWQQYNWYRQCYNNYDGGYHHNHND